MNLITQNIKKRNNLHKINHEALSFYLNKVLNPTKYRKLILPRNSKISNIYKNIQAYTPQGRVLVRVPINKYKVGFKLGMFAATKKPFNFRPKTKKQKR